MAGRSQEEKMLIDAGKYYVVLNVDVTAQDFGNKSAMDEVYYKYGYYLIHNHDKILGEYLRDKLDSTGKVLEGLKNADTVNARRRAGELTHEKECMEEALRLISDME
ncbi:tRNA (adenine(22)-N(1))-methyltransferase TrmK [Coprococcus sp. OM06-25]|uniref:tRNA (adenine(22)-N(1))-methyltransferase TrmK n=1 Tax=Coprococcus sp. OM06-25 TaxID=2293094 RepID=UPI00272DCE4E|nr:tRNA (adenine(22)-N(1))-methyltransferase TrmK [Coprococcus sp. OM06-25]